jgi:RNA polymerase sigma-70 factor (ECF subfamily)
LHRWQRGDRAALDELMPVVYRELRRLAKSYLRRERAEHTLQPTALVNEAYLRLVKERGSHWKNRSQFYGVAGRVMRRILVDHARKREAEKRRAFKESVQLDQALTLAADRDLDLVALDESLAALAAFDPDKCRLVELRYFVGLSIDETAEVLGISAATVKRQWSVAKAWLYRDMATRAVP